MVGFFVFFVLLSVIGFAMGKIFVLSDSAPDQADRRLQSRANVQLVRKARSEEQRKSRKHRFSLGGVARQKGNAWTESNYRLKLAGRTPVGVAEVVITRPAA